MQKGIDGSEDFEAAAGQLGENTDELSAAFLDTATEGRLKAADLEEGLKGHVEQLLVAFDRYVAEDYETAYDSIHETYSHMFGVGTATYPRNDATVEDIFGFDYGSRLNLITCIG